MTTNQLSLLNRLVLAQSYVWVKQVSEEGAEMPSIAYRIRVAGHNSFMINRFNQKERDIIKSIAEDKRTIEIAKTQSSPVIQALELMRIWTEDIPKENRPNINISDSKLKSGKNAYLVNMLKLKKLDEEDHANKREIIADSTVNTEKWYNIAKEIISRKDI